MAQPSSMLRGGDRFAAPKVAVVIALAIEKASLQSRMAHAGDLRLMQSGPGAECARRTAHAAIDAGATALVSWGLAGGLEPQIAPGTVLIPKKVLTHDGAALYMDAGWRARLVASLRDDFEVHEGDLLTADQVLDTPRAKARAAMQTGGVAVDMESAAIATAAAQAGLPVVTVRVVADCLTDTLPADIGQWIDSTGGRRLAPVFKVVFQPGQWGRFIRLARRYRTADRVLNGLAQRLVPSAFDSVLPRSSL
jgi:adenosylhomocysteine nucleosidase